MPNDTDPTWTTYRRCVTGLPVSQADVTAALRQLKDMQCRIEQTQARPIDEVSVQIERWLTDQLTRYKYLNTMSSNLRNRCRERCELRCMDRGEFNYAFRHAVRRMKHNLVITMKRTWFPSYDGQYLNRGRLSWAVLTDSTVYDVPWKVGITDLAWLEHNQDRFTEEGFPKNPTRPPRPMEHSKGTAITLQPVAGDSP